MYVKKDFESTRKLIKAVKIFRIKILKTRKDQRSKSRISIIFSPQLIANYEC